LKKSLAIVFAFFSAAWLMTGSCSKAPDSGSNTTPLTLEIPRGWPAPGNIFDANPITQEGFELGRKLFYDGRLSKDGNFPCASCHQQFAAFSTFDHSLSHGFDNQFTTRNAPGLFNLAWHKELHWDGGINHLEVQPLAPITAPNEMAETVENVLVKLRSDETYRKMFKAAFNRDEINSQMMLRALSQFMGMMVSADSKYDKVKRGEASFTEAEARGYQLFLTNCSACHREPLFTDLSYRNTGMPMDPTLKDRGRMGITRQSSDSLKFKVPSLRNVMLTGPWGHDGRFFSVGQVLDHYRSGVVNGSTTDPLLKNGIRLDIYEKNDLIIFLRTLTDSSFINDRRFSGN
jgi:cytochrome c peroxidase